MDLLTSDDNLSKNHSGIKSLGGGMGGPSGPQSTTPTALFRTLLLLNFGHFATPYYYSAPYEHRFSDVKKSSD